MNEQELGPGSEGDAYRYTKKVLLSLPNVEEIRRIYTEIAYNRNISSWTRACYEELRRQFFRDGQCKIKFAPGLARIAYGELLFGTGDEDFRQLADLRDFVRIISIAHFTEFTRHIAIDGRQMSFKDLVDRFGSTVTGNWKELKKELRGIKYGPRRYRVIWLDSFETAHEYYGYTAPHSWCHLGSRSMFNSYSYNRKTDSNGHTRLSLVKLYLAVLPGFETMKEDDPLYGESMLGIDIGPDGRLMHVNNRWNHAHDHIDERKGDNKYSERELSELMGGPFYELCPPLSKRDYRRMESSMRRRRRKSNLLCTGWARRLAERLTGCILKKGKRSPVRRVSDPRDGREYRVERIGSLDWMLDPVSHMPGPGLRSGDALSVDRDKVVAEWREEDAFNRTCKHKAKRDTGESGIYLANGNQNNVIYTVGADAEPYTPWTDTDPDGTIPDDISVPIMPHIDEFVPLTVLDLDRDGHQEIYLSVDVEKLSSQDSYADKKAEREYLDACCQYKTWRECGLERAEPKDAGHPGAGSTGDDPDFFHMLEMATPLGFSRTSIRKPSGSHPRVMVNDVDSERNFLFYSVEEISRAIPPGWRLPTLFEFLEMAVAKGASIRFGGTGSPDEYGRNTGGTRFSRQVLKGTLFEEFIYGDMSRKYTGGEDGGLDAVKLNRILRDTNFAGGEGADEDVDVQETIVNDDEYGIDIDGEIPRLDIRLPRLDFGMKSAGFAFPETPGITGGVKPDFGLLEDEAEGDNLTRPILLSLDGIAGMTEKEAAKFCERFRMSEGSAKSKFSSWSVYEMDNDLERAVDELVYLQNYIETGMAESGVTKLNIPYAYARWDTKTNSFEIYVLNNLNGSKRYFMLYCVKDNKQLMTTI